MTKRSWIFLVPLVLGFLSLGVAPSQAAGESWKVTHVSEVGCADDAWSLDTKFAGLSGTYVAHTVVSSGGLVYMNQNATGFEDGTSSWGLFASSSYGPTTGTYPIPAGQPMTAVFTLERPLGNVISSWTMVAKSCDSKTLLYNGLTADDGDGDYVNVFKDKCPELKAFTANGCPKGARSLVLSALKSPKRVAGQLVSPGFPGLSSGRTVTVWKVRPGADKKVTTRKTSSSGAFSVKVGPGKYYAESPAVIVPKSGQATADRSPTVKVK
ncbi:MAG: hypothetical protein JWP74_2060 [Marmoricola sp.]|nr:hypothetical protein [Marmoricola sp.]